MSKSYVVLGDEVLHFADAERVIVSDDAVDLLEAFEVVLEHHVEHLAGVAAGAEHDHDGVAPAGPQLAGQPGDRDPDRQDQSRPRQARTHATTAHVIYNSESWN